MDQTMSSTEMEQTLQELFDVIDRLGAEPSNVPLLRRNVELAKKAQMTQEAAGGLEILANTVGCSAGKDMFTAHRFLLEQDYIF